MKRYFAAASVAMILLAATDAYAACSDTTNGTPQTISTLTQNFKDAQQPGSITAGCMRDLIASTAGAASNNINLKNAGLPTGGDDTAAINTLLASALPASFTGTGSLAAAVTLSTSASTASGAVLPFTSTTGVVVGMPASATNIPAGAHVASIVANTSVTLSASITGTVASATPISFGSILTVTGTPGGTIAIGQYLGAANIPLGMAVLSLVTGSGGAGVYSTTGSATASSETITFQPPPTAAVYAPTGLYLHSGDIIVNGVDFYGDGTGTNIRSTNTTGANPTNSIVLTGVNPRLHNMSVTSAWSGTRQTNGDSSGIWVGDDAHGPATAFDVEDVHVVGAASAGMEIYQSNSGTIQNNWVYSTLADGISHGGGTLPSFDNLVEGNYTYNTGDDGISVDTYTGSGMIRNIRIIGNHSINSLARGISVNGALDVLVDDNIVENPAAQGYQAGSDSGQASTTDIIMSHNICNQCGGSTASDPAFFSWGQSGAVASNINWSDNTATAVTTSHCFQLGGGTNFLANVTVRGNKCSAGASSNAYGVALFGVTAPVIEGNTFVGFIEGVSFPGSGGDSGPILVNGNSFDGLNTVGGGGNYAIDLGGETFSSATITSNIQRNDGTTIAGILTVTGIANVVERDNFGDNNVKVITGNTGTNCASSASPAVCGSATTGSAAVPTGTNPTLVVDTTAVLAGSIIKLTPDESLGTKLGITCNGTITTQGPLTVSARTAGTSFTVQVAGSPATNKLCFNYEITN